MGVFRILVSFVAGALVVLAILVAGLKVFDTRETTSALPPESFEVQYLTPQEAARLLGNGSQPAEEADQP